MRYLQALILILLASLSALGQQRSVETQQLFWLGYYQKAQLSTHWWLHSELEGRWFLKSRQQHQWVAPRLHLHYLTKGGTDLAAGVAYFLQAMPHPDEPQLLLRPELRPHQELTLKQPIGRFKLEHRYRIEERFFRKVAGAALAEGWDFSWRFRYRAQLVLPLFPDHRLNPTLKIYNEVLFNAGKAIQHNIFDQNRIGVTLGIRIISPVTAELGYLHWYQQRPSGNAFYSRHIIRYTLVHNFSLSNKS